jgi:hypothetical protein
MLTAADHTGPRLGKALDRALEPGEIGIAVPVRRLRLGDGRDEQAGSGGHHFAWSHP